MQTLHKQTIKNVKRVVIKIGSGILTTAKGVRPSFFKNLAQEVAWLRKKKVQVVIVSSGAIASGMSLLKLKKRPHQIPQKQAVAAIGQPILMQHYARAFQNFHLTVSQTLLTREGLEDRHRFITAKHAMMELLKYQVIPIVNENDTVAVEEIQVGDNDQLSAMVTHLVDADLLLIMTDIDGLYDQDPKKNKEAKRIPVVENVDQEAMKKATDTLNPQSTGGMITKLKAAGQAALYGVPTWVVCGREPNVIRDVFTGQDCGTLFLPKQDALSSRQYWIAYSMKAKGEIVVDEGAEMALIEHKKSLLPSGVVESRGFFNIGDAVDILNSKNVAIARGLVNYTASEIEKIKGAKSSEIEKILGYKYYDEVVNRDDLVVLG